MILPQEELTIFYIGWILACGEETYVGTHTYSFLVHATGPGGPMHLIASGSYVTAKSFPPCLGVVVDADPTGLPVAGVEFDLTDKTTGLKVGTFTTPLTSNGFVVDPSLLVQGDNCQMTLKFLPKPYTQLQPVICDSPTICTSTSFTFTRTGDTVAVVYSAIQQETDMSPSIYTVIFSVEDPVPEWDS